MSITVDRIRKADYVSLSSPAIAEQASSVLRELQDAESIEEGVDAHAQQ